MAGDQESGMPERIGRIHIEAPLGQGGMGSVWLGFDERLERRVAVKILHPEVAADETSRRRFLREARMLSQLRHPNICQVYDLIEEAGQSFLILEYLAGRTLADAAEGLDLEAKLDVSIGILEAIAAAHRKRIMHRDLKPRNVMLLDDGGVKVLDFGLARSLGSRSSDSPNSTSGGVAADGPLTGTLCYMSPEQANRRPVGTPSDLFSIGLILQELWTGQQAYPRATKEELWQRVREAQTEKMSDVDPVLSELIGSLLRIEPELRPSAAETLEVLQALRDRPARRRRRRLVMLMVAVLAAAVITAALGVFQARHEARRQAEIAQRFAREAADIEWRLRTFYLSPPADLRPLRAEILERVDGLRMRMRALGEIGRGPGEYALGRAAVALGDYEGAKHHFDVAWSFGHRPPEVATASGLADLEVYRREATKLRRLRDPKRREEKLAALAAELLDPALARIELGRGAPGDATEPTRRSKAESAHFVDAVAAFETGDFDAALEFSDRAVERHAWLYEADVLIAQIHAELADHHFDTGAYPQAEAEFAAARAAYARAARNGRADPWVHRGACALELAGMAFYLYGPEGDVTPLFEAGVEACDLSLLIDHDAPETWRLLSELHMRRAESLEEGEDPLPLLGQAADLAQEALRRDPDNADAWRSLGHTYSVLADRQISRSEDASLTLERLIAAYSEAHRLAPGQASESNAMGNAYSMRAQNHYQAGRDGQRDSRRAVEAYLRALQLDPDPGYRSNIALAYAGQALYEAQNGLDASQAVGLGLEAQKEALAQHPGYPNGLQNLAELEHADALEQIRQGLDPDPAFNRAVAACEQLIESAGASLTTARRCGPVANDAWDYASACGGDQAAPERLSKALWGRVDVAADSSARAIRSASLRLAALAKNPVDRDLLQDAEDEARAAARLEQGLDIPWLEMGRAALALAAHGSSSHLERAVEAFERAAELRPGRPEAELGIVATRVLHARLVPGMKKDALRALEKARSQHPRLPAWPVLERSLNAADETALRQLLSPWPCPQP